MAFYLDTYSSILVERVAHWYKWYKDPRWRGLRFDSRQWSCANYSLWQAGHPAVMDTWRNKKINYTLLQLQKMGWILPREMRRWKSESQCQGANCEVCWTFVGHLDRMHHIYLYTYNWSMIVWSFLFKSFNSFSLRLIPMEISKCSHSASQKWNRCSNCSRI